MSYQPDPQLPPETILANTGGSPAVPQALPLGYGMNVVEGALAACPQAGRNTTGDTPLLISDNGTSIISTDAMNVDLVLPAGFPRGFRVRSYQGSSGQISYVPGVGATISSGALRSLGDYTNGYFVDIENMGSDTWILLDDTVGGVDGWVIDGMPTIREGDACTFVLTRPDVTGAFPAGSQITVTGTGFNTAGTDYNLVEALQNLANLDPVNLAFDGTSVLTIKPGAQNPLSLCFFATPDYVALGNRDITITISSPSVGSVETASYTTTIIDVSKPLTPDLLFPPATQTVTSDAAGSQNFIVLDNVTGVSICSTVTGDPGIPAGTWVTSITGNTITLSALLTGTVAATTALSFTALGLWCDFSDVSTLTLVSNGTLGTYFNSSGVLTTASTNTARFDYDPSSHTSRGILYEPRRTNLIPNSNSITGWNKTASSTAFNATGLDGTTSATTVTTSSGTNSLNQILTVVAGQQYTFSFYAKAGTMTNVNYAVFNRNTSSFIVAATSYSSLINGSTFTRVSVAFTVPVGCTSIYVDVTANSGVTGTVIITGTQVETGTNATSLMKTTGASAQFFADEMNFTIPGGVTSIKYTFDDSSTQTVNVSAGNYVVPWTLNKSHITTIVDTAVSPAISLDFTSGSLPAGVTYITSTYGWNVSQAVDKVAGYPLTQATQSAMPIYYPYDQNGHNGAQFYHGGGGANTARSLTRSLAAQTISNLAAQASIGDMTLNLTSVSGISVGMGVTYPVTGTSIPRGTVITAINSNIVTLNNPVAAVIISGAPLSFSLDGNMHPTISFNRGISRSQSTIIAIVKPTTQLGQLGGGFLSGPVTFSAGGGSLWGEVPITPALGLPFCLAAMNDGSTAVDWFVNGQPPWEHNCTITADNTDGTLPVSVDNSDGIDVVGNNYGAGMCASLGPAANFGPSANPLNSLTNPSIQVAPTSSTALVINHRGGGTLPAGTQLKFVSVRSGNDTTQLGPPYPTSVTVGVGYFVVYEIIALPRMLSPQEWRGIALYAANKYGTSNLATVSNNTAAGVTKFAISSLTNISKGQIVIGTGIATGTTVIGVNHFGTTEITLDTPVQPPGLTAGATLAFATPSFKQPKFLDVSQFDLIYRDDFKQGLRYYTGTPGTALQAGASGWTMDTGFIANFPYSPAAHGYLPFKPAFCLDVVNYIPWRKYNPFTTIKEEGAETGSLVITGSTAPNEVAGVLTAANLPGYTGITGLALNQAEMQVMYGYFEGRVKGNSTIGTWFTFWLTAVDGSWPPEIDICEQYGFSPGSPVITTHNNATYTAATPDHGQSDTGHFQNYFAGEYTLLGVEIGPNGMDFYVNREWIRSLRMPWDFHTFWTFNLMMQIFPGTGSWDGVTPLPGYYNYVAAWRRKAQTPTVPTGTQAETTALVAAMVVPPDGTRQTLINTLIASLKTYQCSYGGSLWDQLDFLFVPAAHNAQAARIDWKNPAKVGTEVGSPSFTANMGYRGATGVSFVDTNIALATAGFQLTQSQNHIGAVMLTSGVTDQTLSVGSVGSPSYWLQFTDHDGWAANNLSGVGTAGRSQGQPIRQTSNGYCVATRNHYQMHLYVNGQYGHSYPNSQFGDNQAALDTTDMLFANSAYTTALFHGGKFLSADDVRDMNTLFNTYLTAVGAL